jgi:hypothetical protein
MDSPGEGVGLGSLVPLQKGTFQCRARMQVWECFGILHSCTSPSARAGIGACIPGGLRAFTSTQRTNGRYGLTF